MVLLSELEEKINVLIVGKGGRESEFARLARESAFVDTVHMAPTNGMTAQWAKTAPKPDYANDCREFLQYLRDENIRLVISGSESDLVMPNMLGDSVRLQDIPFKGASSAAAEFERSKIVSRNVGKQIGVPQPEYQTFEATPEKNFAAARQYAAEQFEAGVAGLVVKDDGLCGGKGVKVVSAVRNDDGTINVEKSMYAFEEGLEHLNTFGHGGDRFIVEHMLEGAEISATIVVGADCSYKLLAFSQDYKPIGEGDTGDNTGGLGAATIDLPDIVTDYIKDEIIEPYIDAAEEIGRPMQGGILYIGLMLNEDGVYVVETNMRGGDPETQVVFRKYAGDTIELLHAAATGENLHNFGKGDRDEHYATVARVAIGYPGDSSQSQGKPITGIEAAGALENVDVIPAGIKKDEASGQWQIDGTRVVYVTGKGATQEEALEGAYKGVALIESDGLYHRNDIGCNIPKVLELANKFAEKLGE